MLLKKFCPIYSKGIRKISKRLPNTKNNDNKTELKTKINTYKKYKATIYRENGLHNNGTVKIKGISKMA